MSSLFYIVAVLVEVLSHQMSPMNPAVVIGLLAQVTVRIAAAVNGRLLA